MKSEKQRLKENKRFLHKYRFMLTKAAKLCIKDEIKNYKKKLKEGLKACVTMDDIKNFIQQTIKKDEEVQNAKI